MMQYVNQKYACCLKPPDHVEQLIHVGFSTLKVTLVMSFSMVAVKEMTITLKTKLIARRNVRDSQQNHSAHHTCV
jgi:phosphotransferase system IIA component